jgi:hypothetical protein
MSLASGEEQPKLSEEKSREVFDDDCVEHDWGTWRSYEICMVCLIKREDAESRSE